MQVSGRLGGVIGSYLGGLMSSAVQVGVMLFDGRSGWVIGKYSRGLLSSTMLEGRPR